MKKILNSLVVITVLFLLSGCAAKQAVPRFVWPPPPEEPRLEFKGVYSSETDLQKGDGLHLLEGFLGDFSGDRFATPMGIAADSNGKVYISDIHMRDVWIYDFPNKKVDMLSKVGSFATPLGMDVDKNNNLYVADGGKGLIFVFDENRLPLQTIGSKDELTKPVYLTVNDKLGRLYVSDALEHRVVVYDLAGKYLFSFGKKGSGEGQFYVPQGLAFSPAGDLFVVDNLNARIQIFDADGQFKYQFGKRGDRPGQFESPKDISFDSEGNVYVVEGRRSNVEVFNSKGELLLVLGDGRPSSSPFGFSTPRAVAITEDDRIYISQALGRRFSVWQYFDQKYKREHPITAEDKRILIRHMEKIREENRR